MSTELSYLTETLRQQFFFFFYRITDHVSYLENLFYKPHTLLIIIGFTLRSQICDVHQCSTPRTVFSI